MRYLDHPDQDLNPLAFAPEAGTMRLYGKSDAPPPPDYEAAARATAQGNKEATQAAVKANRINQYTPYGSLEYSQKPTGQIDYDAYNKAVQSYNTARTTAPASAPAADNSYNNGLSRNGMFNIGRRNAAPAQTGQNLNLVAPKPEDFMKYDPDSGWTQTQTLTPQAQAALDQQLSLNQKYGEVANIGFDKARSIFENPELDMSQMPERAVAPGQTAQQAIMARLQPQLAQQEEALRTQMANQGITLGSNAYGQEMNQQGQRRNDLEMQAAMQGISLDQQARTAAMQEQAYMQDRPLNLINALRSGNQVNAPQFQQFAQQATTQGPDLLGAANAQYGAAVDANNASNAQTSGMMSGLLGIGMGMAGMPVMGGGSLMGNFLGK